MVDTITESFCERCGTRYEFKAPTRLNPLRKTRGLIGGLKNYLTSQDALGDAIGDAMRGEEEGLASAQLEAFHESFNFCIDCRQYTCLNCWNDGAGRCRSCAPVAGKDDLIEQLEASHAGAAVAEPLPRAELDARLGLDAWPMADLQASGANGHRSDRPVEPEHVPEAEPEPIAAEVEPEPEPDPIAAAVESELVAATTGEEPVAAEIEPEPMPAPLRVLGWDADADLGIDEQPPAGAEPEPVAAEVEPEPEPVAAEVEPEPEPVAAEVEPEPEPEPVAAEVEPEPEQPRRPITPISETILRTPSRSIPRPEQPPTPAPELEVPKVAAQAEDPQLAARRAQLDLLGLGDPGEGPVAPDQANVLPYRSRGASVHAAEVAAMVAAGQPMSFWEASAREVAGAASNVGVHSCGECGLSLSATARFCRRCGTRQARSA